MINKVLLLDFFDLDTNLDFSGGVSKKRAGLTKTICPCKEVLTTGAQTICRCPFALVVGQMESFVLVSDQKRGHCRIGRRDRYKRQRCDFDIN